MKGAWLRHVTCRGRFVYLLGPATVNLYTKYEVSIFTHYEDMKGDMKGDEKCKNWGVWGVRSHPRSLET